MIAEKQRSHRCDQTNLPIRGCEELVLDHITDSGQDTNGDHLHLAWAVDGMLYRLLVCEHNPPHGTKRKFPDPDTKHEGTSALANNAGRCPRCNTFVIAEQVHNHKCKVELKGVREVFLESWVMHDHKDENDDSLSVAMGLDGYMYRLVLCAHNPPHSAKRKFTGCGTKQGLDSTSEEILYRPFFT
jgi:hypothetical protein